MQKNLDYLAFQVLVKAKIITLHQKRKLINKTIIKIIKLKIIKIMLNHQKYKDQVYNNNNKIKMKNKKIGLIQEY